MFEQVEQVLKMLTFLGAAFLSNWLQFSPRSALTRLTAGQTLYRSISNRLASAAGPINPGSGANGKPLNQVV